ncbi:MAG: class I SAM-dependent methyltransferase [Candidatus Dadabacteria bacterium]|nr:MAG: class I SAM-dependent methyltransferase [Candidatus Dadabacteria bacterium]
MAKASRRPRRRRHPRRPSLASTADKYALYLKSVQSPDYEVAFFRRVYVREFGRPPRTLREDFCGTAAVCCQWVRRHPERRAIGVDIDPEPLEWGRRHNVAALELPAQQRVTLVRADARRVFGPKADVVAAQNFSYYCFKTRAELRRYFRAAYRNLARRGLLVLDVLGGSEVMEEGHEEVKRMRTFQYVWEQHRFDPITHYCRFFIHFRFPDGSEKRRAFSYDWRLWTMPEIRELLAEAGFARSDVYWEGTSRKTGRGNDVYVLRKHAPADPAWVAYVVAVKR